jgi:putative DNA primase/helicase
MTHVTARLPIVRVPPSTDRSESSPDLPVIRLGLDTDRVVGEAIERLAEAENTFARGGVLVRVVADAREKKVKRDHGAPTIRPHTPATLDRELSTVARFERRKKVAGEWRAELAAPPKRILSALLEAGTWPHVRPLAGVASAPILRADGTVAQSPGYDHASGYLLAFDAADAIAIGNAPSKADAVAARDALLRVVKDFPFEAMADQAAWLGLGLTLLARAAIDGPCPMWLVTANVRGAGKSRLIDVASVIATGREASRATQPHDDAEAGKLITSIVLAGDELLLLDNIDRPLGGSKLDALLTGARWKDRMLGVNATIDLPIRVVLAGTGNNIELRGDTHRRVLPVRLDSPHERPEDRTDFDQPDLLRAMRRDRPRLVAHALTILRAWFAAGRPCTDARPWGSYESWAGLIPHVLRWIDLPDPQETRAELEADDPHHRALAAVLAHWHTLEVRCGATGGITIREAITRLYPEGSAPEGDELDDLRAALETLAPGRGTVRVDARALGHAFRRARRRVLGGVRLVQTGDDGHAKVARWTVTSGGEP